MERLTVDEMLECLGEYADHESAKQLIAMIEELKQYKDAEEQGLLIQLLCKVVDTVLAMMEELTQYRVIGTPEECRKSVSICKAMIERKLTPENMEEYMKFEDECVKRGFTFKSLLEAREKQVAKAPIIKFKNGEFAQKKCACCGNIIMPFDGKYCNTCGQRLER